MKQILTTILKAIVKNPDEVEVIETSAGNNLVLCEIKVNKSDLGRVIGRNGKTLNLIYDIMKIVSSNNNKRIQLSIIEDHYDK